MRDGQGRALQGEHRDCGGKAILIGRVVRWFSLADCSDENSVGEELMMVLKKNSQWTDFQKWTKFIEFDWPEHVKVLQDRSGRLGCPVPEVRSCMRQAASWGYEDEVVAAWLETAIGGAGGLP